MKFEYLLQIGKPLDIFWTKVFFIAQMNSLLANAKLECEINRKDNRFL